MIRLCVPVTFIAALAVIPFAARAQPAGATAGASKPVASPAAHHSHRHRAVRRHLASLTPTPGVAPQARSQIGDGLPGSPAPVPNENAGPPNQPTSPDPHLQPGNLSIHYPPVGEGYVTGSSPQAIDDRNAQKVPGLTVSVPLQQGDSEPVPAADANGR